MPRKKLSSRAHLTLTPDKYEPGEWYVNLHGGIPFTVNSTRDKWRFIHEPETWVALFVDPVPSVRKLLPEDVFFYKLHGRFLNEYT